MLHDAHDTAETAFVLGFQGLKPPQAWAAISACRVDPQVYLADGTVVTLTTLIDVPPNQVRELHYVLHIPMGAKDIKVTYPGGRQPRETVRIVSDDVANAFDSTTVTVTSADHTGVTDTTTVTSSTGTPVQVTAHMDVSGQRSSDVSGWSGQLIALSVWMPGTP